MILSFVAIGVGAALGAWLRWGLGAGLNPLFPSLPLGTLAANLLGGYLMGLFMGLSRDQPFFPEPVRLGIATGFLGGLTTFSTFSAETVTLLSHQQYAFLSISVLGNVGGSIVATVLGILTIKLFT